MSSDTVIIEQRAGVGIVTLNRPEAMNALSRAMRMALYAAFVALDADPLVHVIILTGAGDRAFSAGLDLKELGQDPGAMTAIVDTDSTQNVTRAMEVCRKPIIGAINGVAITGGLELALGCDMLFAASSARFADTHVLVEAMPGWGLSQRLQRAIGLMRAKEMSFSGRFIDAETALQWGLVNRVVPPELLLPQTLEFARNMAGFSPAMLGAYKSLIDRGAALPLGEALALERTETLRDNATFDTAAVDAKRHGILARNRQ